MKKIILTHKEFLIGLILTISLLWPLIVSPYFTHHDDVQFIRLFEMNKCIQDNQIPCRWVPDLGGLYGYPIFNYYAPLPYYFGELVYLIIGNFLISAKIMFGLSFLGAYIFMYLLGSKLWGKRGGSLAGIFYSFAPYHALDFYIRGAMGEMWALMLFPAVFWAAIKLEEKTNIANLLLVALTFAALITSHNLSAMIFTPILLIWIMLLFLKSKNIRFIWFVFGSVICALLISASYLLPAVIEKDLVHLETTVSGYFSYTEHFKGLKKLILERNWGYGASIREVPGGEKDGLSYQIGFVHLAGWVLALVSAIVLWKKRKWLSLFIIFCSTIVLLSIVMIHPRSLFIWKVIEPLKYLQFPWRFLMLIIFSISIISGSIFTLKFKKMNLLWIVLVVAVVVLNFSYFKPEKFVQINDRDLQVGKNWDKLIKRSIFDYLPIYAKEPPAELAKARYEILTGDSRVFDYYEGTNWITFKTETRSHTIIRLSQYYFPNWRVFVDNQETRVEYKNNSLGLMTIILGNGDHIISARLYDTPIRFIANSISLVGIVVSAILLLISFKSVRKWIVYYRRRMN